MTEKAPDLNALVGSRICHDLISPLGAIGNGVELLSMTGAVQGPEMALIAESVGNASAKIRFFRIAFGAARGQDLGPTEILAILKDMTALGRIQIDWAADTNVSRSEARLLFLLILCLESAIPFDGRIHIARSPRRWRLEATAQRLNIVPENWELLSNPGAAAGLSPGTVHFALVGNALKDANRRMSIEILDTTIKVSV